MSAVILKFDPNAYMTLTRFRKIKQYMKLMYVDKDRKERNDAQ
jgi:hypothetical protein